MKLSNLWQWFLGEKSTKREPLGKYMLGALKVVLIVCALTQIAHADGKLSGKQTNTLDAALHLNPIVAKAVTVIAINNDDYAKLFNGRSPLGPDKLVRLIEAASLGEPSVIAVDVDTTDPVYRQINLIRDGNSQRVKGIECLPPQPAKPSSPEESKSLAQSSSSADPSLPATIGSDPQPYVVTFKKPLRIVWAVSASPKEIEEASTKKPPTDPGELFWYDCRRAFEATAKFVMRIPKHLLETFGVIHEELPEMILGGVLGRPHIDVPEGDSGTSALPVDGDGMIRHYFRTVRKPGSHDLQETLPFAVYRAWAEAQSPKVIVLPTKELTGLSEKFVMRLPSRPGDIPNYKASRLLDDNGKPAKWISGEHSGWYDTVHGNVVVIGGHFGAARDEYVTPAGLKFGVDLMAAAIESEIQKVLIAPANPFLLLGGELLVGMGLSFLCWAFPNGWIAEGAFGLMPIIAPFLSVIFFSTTSMWFDFAAVIYAAGLHQKFEQKAESKKLREELAHLQALHGEGDNIPGKKDNQPEESPG